MEHHDKTSIPLDLIHEDNSVMSGSADPELFLVTYSHIVIPVGKDATEEVTVVHNEDAEESLCTVHIDHAGSTTLLAIMTTNVTIHASTVPAVTLPAALLTTTGATISTLA